MKTVILAAGEGKRLRPLTYNRPKVMLPVANRPILEHLLLNAKKVGLKDFIFVVSYKKDTIVDYFGDGKKWGVKIEYINQLEPLGTAHAIATIEKFLEDEFLVLSGDTIVGSSDIKKISTRKNFAMGIKKHDNVTEYGTVKIENKKIKEICEKSGFALSNYINLGVYFFKKSIFDAIKKTKVSKRGELEITDSLQMLIDGSKSVDAVYFKEWIDASRPWDLLSINEFLLKNTENKIKSKIEEKVTIKGNLSLGRNTKIMAGTYIEGPVVIGEHCKIGPNCYIRPYTSIGNNCHIGNACEVKNSIIMNNTSIPHHNYVGDSIIGENCNLGAGTKIANLRLDKKPVHTISNGDVINTGRKKFGVIIGDDVQTGINATINVGANIGNNCFIGPGAIVKGKIESGCKIF